MTTTLDRGRFTAFLLEALRQHGALDGFEVGDAEAPRNAGWIGEPNAPMSKFKPYLVLAGQGGTRSQGSFAEPQDTWQLPYSLAGIGVSREQADWIADRAGQALVVLKKAKVDLGASRWKILDVTVTALGFPSRRDGTEPPFWQRDDGLSLYLTKERT